MIKLALNPFIAIVLGFFVQLDSRWLDAVPYALMFIMLNSFIEINTNELFRTNRNTFILLFVMGFMAILFVSIIPQYKDLGEIGALLSITPTAIAAPALTRILGKDYSLVSTNVIYSTLFFIFLVIIFSLLVGADKTANLSMFSLIGIIIIPFTLSRIIRKYIPRLGKIFRRPILSLGLWCFILFVSTANVSEHIASNLDQQLFVLIITALIFFTFFVLGIVLGKVNKLELAQSLSQKNTMIAIWFTINYLPGAILLAPIYYSIIQNIVFSILVQAKDKAIWPNTLD